MNEEDPKPGVVIDVDPEPMTSDNEALASDESAAAETQDAAQPSPRKQGGGLLALILSVLALIGVAVAAFFGYQQWIELKNGMAVVNARLEQSAGQQQQLKTAIGEATQSLQKQQGSLGEQRDLLSQQRLAVEEARTAFKQQEEQLANENVRLQEREAELRAAVADVHRRVGRSGTQWIIAETEYLLRIASHRLILARDTGAAQVALELADQRLRDTKDPGWAGVREQIARDIARLSTFEAPDTAGLSAKLAALIEQIPQLKIARATIGADRTLPERVAHKPGERNWETLIEDVWAGFKDSVRIRERDKPVQAMLAPEHQFFLYENLKLHLEAARLGLARDDQALFRDNLATAAESLDRYFAVEDGAAAAIAKSVREMRAIEIKPDMPDISQSLRALRVRMKLMEDVAPGGDKAE